MNKIHPLIKVKNSQKLFDNQYKYKTVIVCPAAAWFRSKNLDHAEEMLSQCHTGKLQKYQWLNIKSPEDYEYSMKVLENFKNLSDYHLRIEQPFLSFYTNDYKSAVDLANLDPLRTKYVCIPPENFAIKTDEIVLKRVPYGYKVTVGRTKNNYRSFVEWSDKSNKIKMTKTCKLNLCKDRSWGGFYFYVKDDLTMTMVNVFIGSDIARIDKVINLTK